ncbi:high frequency lysogenization protein HflD [Methylomonas methanica]|uniref:High frequency lysogenization protein HflD homolog n=1 Tax=Methylomonas methanica (strain DSM 25384 / MC09) TaxID=857087 RepID=G0A2N7_METMM|nr:high frequency lysogenization protein HflD [Methylomonas methanica]AEG01390.1 High frequency lysogenization protein hflD [Methylomonas methanica MC09]
MSLISLSNQTIALAGVAQACSLVRQLATTGNADLEAMTASIGSILKIDSDSVADVYGGLIGIKHGLEQLNLQLTSRVVANPEQARYAAQLVHLQKQLSQNPDMLDQIRTGITKAQTQAEHFGVMHENVLANLADVYHGTISTLQPRIMINGDPQHLGNQTTVNKIRALLLAGIRASLLWRQCGGSRWHLLLSRKKLHHEANHLLSQI